MRDIPGDVTHIHDRHWLGSQPGSYMGEFDLVVCCSRQPADMLDYRPVIWLPFADIHRRPPMEHLAQVSRMVRDSAAKCVLWHCQAGLNRSALALGIHLVDGGMGAAAAMELMRERRAPAVLSNSSFVVELTRYAKCVELWREACARRPE